MAIDYGDKNIGVAVSDPFNNMAMPLLTIARKDKHTIKPYVAQIGAIIKEKNVGTIVLGLPKNMDNTYGKRAEITIEFKERLQRNFKNTQIILWDERLSTIMAQKLLQEQKISVKKQKTIIDQLSACIILQNFLDYNKRLEQTK